MSQILFFSQYGQEDNLRKFLCIYMMITVRVTSRCIQSVTIKSLAGQDDYFIVLRLLVTHHLMLTYAIHTTLWIIKRFRRKLFPDVISRTTFIWNLCPNLQCCSTVGFCCNIDVSIRTALHTATAS